MGLTNKIYSDVHGGYENSNREGDHILEFAFRLNYGLLTPCSRKKLNTLSHMKLEKNFRK